MPGFSPQAIAALVQVVTGGPGMGTASKRPQIGLYRSGTDLRQFFGALGFNLSIGMESRVDAVRGLVLAANQRPDAEKRLGPVFEAAVSPFDYEDEPEKHAAALAHLNAALRTDGYELVEHSAGYRLLSVRAQSPAAAAVREVADMLDLDTVRHHLDDALALVTKRPDGAIRAACSTVESVCSTILTRLNLPLPSDRSITPLYKETAKALNLAPDRPDLTADLKQILGGLANTVSGIGSLRTHAGDAHGQPAGTPRADARIARLAVHAASAVSEFLIETWQRRTPNRTP